MKQMLLLRAISLLMSVFLLEGTSMNANIKMEESKLEEQQENEKEDVIKITTQEEIRTWIKQEEITTENWKDFLEIKENKWEEKDVFDEPTGDYHIGLYLITLPHAYVDDGCAFRFSVDQNHSNALYDSSGAKIWNYVTDENGNEVEEIKEVKEVDMEYYNTYSEENMGYSIAMTENKWIRAEDAAFSLEKNTINSIDLMKVKGTVRTIAVPDEAWNEPDETGKKYIQLEIYYFEPDYVKLYEDYSTDKDEPDTEKNLSRWLTYIPQEEKH